MEEKSQSQDIKESDPFSSLPKKTQNHTIIEN